MSEHQPATNINEHAPYEQPDDAAGLVGGNGITIEGNTIAVSSSVVIGSAAPFVAAKEYEAGALVREQGAILERKTAGTSEASFVLDYTHWTVVGGIPTNVVWLQDPTLTGTIADKTGTVAADAVLAAARTRVAAMPHKLAISGEPGVYKIEEWHTYFASHTCLTAPPGAPLESLIFRVTTKWEHSKAVSVPKTTAAKGATSIVLEKVHGEYVAASAEHPQPVIIEGLGAFTYTGITGAGESVTLTGLSPALPSEVKATFTHVVQGVAMYFDDGASAGLETTLGSGVLIEGPHVGTLTEWGTETPPEEGTGIWLGKHTGMAASVTKFVFGVAFASDHQRFLETARVHECYAGACWDWPYTTRGSQSFAPGASFASNRWAGFYVTAKNEIGGISGEPTLGLQPWCVWKEKTEGVAGANTTIIGLSTATLTAEDYGIGMIGCPDCLSFILRSTLTIAGAQQLNESKPPGASVVAMFACKAEGLVLHQSGSNNGNIFESTPYIKSDKFLATCPENILQAFPAESFVKVLATKPRIELGFTNGAVLTCAINTIKANELVAYRNAVEGGIELVGGTANVPPCGLTTGPSEEYCVPVLFTGQTLTVAVREQSTPPTTVTAAKLEEAGELVAEPYYLKVVSVTSSLGTSGASAEATVTPVANKGLEAKWAAPAEQHSQKWTKHRIYISKVKGVFTEGYIEVGEVLSAKFLKASELKTGTSEKLEPATINKGVEIYGNNLVRAYGTSAPGKACVASSSAWEPGVCGKTYSSADNGVTATMQIVPRLA